MSRLMKTGLLLLVMVFFCGVTIASAGDRDRKRDRKRDGSCQSYFIGMERGARIATDRTKKQDRKRDGSCQSYTVEKNEGMTLAADRTRDRKRDC
jgi:hypothetical protein